MWAIIKEIIETLYYLSGILLLIGVIIAIKELKILKKDVQDKYKRAAIESSLHYLEIAKSIIVDIADYDAKFNKEIPEREDTSKLFDGKFKINPDTLDKELLIELIVAGDLGIDHIFNQLEVFSVAMNSRVADESIVYTPFSNFFCEFIEKEHLMLSVMRYQGAPYKNLLELYTKWKNRMEIEQLELQKNELENKIKKKGNNYKPSTPIGL